MGYDGAKFKGADRSRNARDKSHNPILESIVLGDDPGQSERKNHITLRGDWTGEIGPVSEWGLS